MRPVDEHKESIRMHDEERASHGCARHAPASRKQVILGWRSDPSPGGPGGLTGYAIDPTTMYTSSPPPSATITGGGGIDPTYGMPLVQYFDPTGTLQGQAYATYVSPDGTSLSGPVPDLSSAPSGMYTGVVLNAGPNNTVIQVGAATTEVITGCP